MQCSYKTECSSTGLKRKEQSNEMHKVLAPPDLWESWRLDMKANMEKERDDDDGIDPDEPKKNNPFEEAEVFERAGVNQVAKGQNH
jgi:hypothetical protein